MPSSRHTDPYRLILRTVFVAPAEMPRDRQMLCAHVLLHRAPRPRAFGAVVGRCRPPTEPHARENVPSMQVMATTRTCTSEQGSGAHRRQAHAVSYLCTGLTDRLAVSQIPNVHNKYEALNQHLDMCAHLQTHAVTWMVSILPCGSCRPSFTAPKFDLRSHFPP